MSNYYFPVSSLPRISVGEAPDLSFTELINLLKENLLPSDLQKCHRLRTFYVLEDLRAMWSGLPLSAWGYYTRTELEESLVMGEGLPDYVYDFVRQHDSDADCLAHFSQLMHKYFEYEIEDSEGFIHDYLCFEREWRLVMLGYRAKLLKRDVATELQYEDPHDELVVQIMAQKDAPTFVPPSGFEDLGILFEENHDAPLEMQKALCVYRFKRIHDLTESEVFSIEKILSYMVRLVIVEQWQGLDQDQGLKIIDSIMKEVR